MSAESEMIEAEALGLDRMHGRELYLVTLDRFDQWSSVQPGFDFFTTLIATDARELPNGEILEVAEQMVRRHCGYVSTWGPDCERVHDVYDKALLLAEYGPNKLAASDRAFLMSTWHDKEPLDEALWFALHAFPTDAGDGFDYEGSGVPPLVAVTTSADWAGQIRRRLQNQDAFAADILAP
jgi:hypothetical protein